ncbi:adenylyltransferase/cytidyltransferase family protein [Patescibacteria group bacterium]|nr:adenylyltransferase/cytidyltransferase family protein [Patescibacteria group bacterium]MBU4452928.1 adenylyltransferase/cytidyltransferase family protein [Patescibacteria group bacterium]MCG2687896.1 adenylyltransferase/cytidyltransferase family protein [Candidatus Parcubacteria bacterium]
MKTALVFGTFDRLHEGHINLFEQIKNQGYSIIVCLALDEIVRQRKGMSPVQGFNDRMQVIKSIKGITKVIKGDLIEGKFTAIKLEKPNVIAIGYDQTELKLAIQTWLKSNKLNIPIIKLKPFNPQIFKSSLLRNTDNN